VSTASTIIVLLVAAIALAVVLGFRAPDRVPGEDQLAERERIDN
jgi:hypothetical protein